MKTSFERRKERLLIFVSCISSNYPTTKSCVQGQVNKILKPVVSLI